MNRNDKNVSSKKTPTTTQYIPRFSTFPWMYLLAGVFKDAEMAFISYVCINLFISINTVLPTSILYFMSQLSQTDTKVRTSEYQRIRTTGPNEKEWQD